MQRTKTLSFKLVVLLLIACLVMSLLPTADVKAGNQQIYFAGFEDDVTTGWYRPWNGTFSVTGEKSYWGDKSLKFTGRQNSWDSPAINLYNMIKQNGAGTYMVQMSVLVDDLVEGGEYGHLLIRGNQENSFITPGSNGNYYYKLTSTVKFVENEWYHFTGSFVVTNSDISTTSGLFNLCFDFVTPTATQNIYIDNVRVIKMEPLQVIPTAETLYVGDRLILDVNRYNYTTYTSSNPSVATVDSTGIVLAIAPGRTTITVNYNNIETAECVVDVKNVEDGQYFIKNVKLGNYIQRKETNEIIEVKTFDGALDQRWDFSYVGEGYYKITCASGGKAITVIDTDSANKALEVSDYTGANTQKWRFEQLNNGNFKIVPKEAIDANKDWSMAIGEGLNVDGRNVEYRNYSNLNNQEKGHWEIELIHFKIWNSDYDEVGYWENDPSIYYENIYVETGMVKHFYFNEGRSVSEQLWENALSIELTRTEVKEDAQIECYGGSVADMVSEYGITWPQNTLGFTDPCEKNQVDTIWVKGEEQSKKVYKFEKAKIYIAYFPYVDDQPYSVDQQYETMAHELGHALGYMGHSGIPNHLMYRKKHNDYTIHEIEKKHLKQIYEYYR